MNEKAVPFKKIEPGLVISQGRGGQAIIQDVVGNMLLTTQNKTGSNQQTLSVNDSISSIALLSGEAPTSIDTKIEFPSNNFNTINYEQTPISEIQFIKPIITNTTQSLESSVDIIPTQSVIQNNTEVQPQELIPFLTSSLFLDEQLLPDEESELYSDDVEGIQLEIPPSLNSVLLSINNINKNTQYDLTKYEKLGGKQPYKRTITTPLELIKIGKSKNIDKQLLKSIITVIKIEQNYKGFNFNLSGTEAGNWPGIEKYSNGYVYATEGGTNLRKPFVSFKSLEDQIDFVKAAFIRKNLKISSSQSSQEWAKLWYKNWNGYGARSVKKEVAKFKTLADFDAYVLKTTSGYYAEIDKLVNKLY
jgi:hypothetical protein